MNVGYGRLSRELKNYEKLNKEDSNIRLNLTDQKSLFKWTAYIKGPRDTSFEGGIYEIRLEIPQDYPNKPPDCKFITKIFHPNVDFNTGEICHELFKEKWLPTCSLESVCRMILDLMVYPNAESPLNCDAGNLIRNGDMIGFNSLVRMYCIDYAMKYDEEMIFNMNRI